MRLNLIRNQIPIVILLMLMAFTWQVNAQLQKFPDIKSVSDTNVILEQIDRSEFSTRIQLAMRVNKEGESYCLWDVGDKHAFILEDVDTAEIYPLQAQNSQLGSCNEEVWVWMLPDDPVETQLFFPALPSNIKRIKLYEVSADDNSIPAVFDVIELAASTQEQAETNGVNQTEQSQQIEKSSKKE